MKYLFIVTEIQSANGVCTKAVMEKLVEQGNIVHCISNKEYNLPEHYEVGNIQYHTVKPRLTYSLSSLLNHKNMNGLYRKLIKLMHLILNKTKLLIRVRKWPWISPAYTKRIYKKSKSLCITEKIDCIVPVFTQIDTLIVAEKIKKEFPQIKYVPYFLDSMSGGYGPRQFTREMILERGLKWERKLLPAADAIIMMESSRKHHIIHSKDEDYFEKIHFLDLPLLKDLTQKSNKQKNTSDVILVYVGSLPAGIRSPEYILKVFEKIPYDNWKMHFIGTSDCAILNEAAKDDKRIIVTGRCEHAKALEFEASATVLINIGNSNKYMMPSKLFEYMSFGKPIISISVIDDDVCEEYLKQYTASLILDSKKNDLEGAAAAIEEFVKKEMETDVIDIREKLYKNTPEATAELLERINGQGKQDESSTDQFS